MTAFTYTVTITCKSQADAERVIGERLGFDEDYGFEYTLDFEHASGGDNAICGSLTVRDAAS